jgi:hypothetical protein
VPSVAFDNVHEVTFPTVTDWVNGALDVPYSTM